MNKEAGAGPFVTKGHFKSTGGPEKIYYRLFNPACNGTALVIVHDFYDYHGRYARLIDSLAQGGSLVGVLDFKGHGLSMGIRGHMDNFDDYAGDLVKFINETLKRDVILVAQGSGVLLALRVLQIFKMDVAIRALVAANPFFSLKREGYEKGVRTFLRYGGTWSTKIRLPYPIAGNMLTHCPEVAREHDEDPLIGHYFSVGLFKELLEAKDRVWGFIPSVPVLLLVGQKDPLCDSREAIRYHRGKEKSVTLKAYRNMKHDLFNDTGNRAVFNDIKEWTEVKQ